MPSHIVISAVFLAALTFASPACTDRQPTPAPTTTPASTNPSPVVSISTSAPLSSPVPPDTPTTTPKSTPTPEPTDAPTPSSRSASAPTAAPVSATHTCDLMNTPYDTLAMASGAGEEWRLELRDSGPDRHMVSTITATGGTLIAKIEDITKHRTMYSRESMPDNPETYGEWRIVGTDLSQPFSIPCLDPGSFDASASGPSDEPHLTTETFLSEEEGSMRNEFWADSTGRPTRSRRTFFPPEYDGVTNTETGVIEFTYSDYGESNIIEAPCASAAPDEADNPGLMRDCVYLLELMDPLAGTAMLNWSLDTPVSRWRGVNVEGSPARVTQLILASQELNGTVPWVLSRLDGLKYLWLDDNQLTGQIPDALGHLSNLRSLTLNHNQLTGEIPAKLGRLSNLRSLRLGNNQLTGCIPPVLRDNGDHDLDSLGLQDCETP